MLLGPRLRGHVSREAAAKRTSFFAHLATLSAHAVFPSWSVFLEALATFTAG
jgi:hypothetical protein